MLNVLSALCFAGFVLAGLILTALGGRLPHRRVLLASVFALYSLAASFGAGLTQHDAWPFSKWNFAAGLSTPTVTSARILGVDARGREHRIDYRAWQPLGFDELNAWMLLKFPRLPEAAEDRVAAYLLDRAEVSRRRARAGGRLGSSERFFGPLAAPCFVLHEKIWSEPSVVPPDPFVALRVYRETWEQEARRRDERAVRRLRVYEYPRP